MNIFEYGAAGVMRNMVNLSKSASPKHLLQSIFGNLLYPFRMTMTLKTRKQMVQVQKNSLTQIT